MRVKGKIHHRHRFGRRHRRRHRQAAGGRRRAGHRQRHQRRARREGRGAKSGRPAARRRFFAADVTKSADVKALVEAAVQRHGKLDVMVNNAGWTHRNRPALEVSEEEFDKCYAVNMKSIYLVDDARRAGLPGQQGRQLHQHRLDRRRAAAAGPDLVQRLQGRGHHHQQVAGRRTRARTTSASTASTRCSTPTPACRPNSPAARSTTRVRAKFMASIPLGRFSTALDVANAALYLASDEAAFISGVCIEVDGARCVRA